MKLNKLKEYFSSIELPKELQLNNCTFIKDVHYMIDSHIAILESNRNNKIFIPYYNRLIELYEKINK